MVEKIKRLCAKKRITLAELERELNFPKGSIYKWDKNRPSVDKVKKVADYFGVSIEYFLEEKEEV